MRRLAAFFVAFALAFAVAAADNLAPQTSSQAGVTVKVTPLTLDGPAWAFSVAFDTHSQALQDDLLKSAVLIPIGSAPLAPLAWEADPAGGHHRKGVLRFKAPSALPVSIELRITRPGESAPRRFAWDLRR